MASFMMQSLNKLVALRLQKIVLCLQTLYEYIINTENMGLRRPVLSGAASETHIQNQTQSHVC